MSKQPIVAGLGAALVVLAAGAGEARADFRSWLYDLSLGPYTGGMGYSYNVAYSYGLPFNSASGYSPWTIPYDRPYRPPSAYRPWLFRHATPAAAGPGDLPPLIPVPETAADGAALLDVAVPADAEVWVDGVKTTQTGSERVFHSPTLAAGKEYVYLVRARWTEGGRLAEQIRTVPVRSGQRVRVDFTPRAGVPDFSAGPTGTEP